MGIKRAKRRRGIGREKGREMWKEIGKETGREIGEEIGKETGKETGKEVESYYLMLMLLFNQFWHTSLPLPQPPLPSNLFPSTLLDLLFPSSLLNISQTASKMKNVGRAGFMDG